MEDLLMSIPVEVISKQVSFKIPDRFECPISRLIMAEPVQASDGFVYEKEEIEKYMQLKAPHPALGPMTKEPLDRNYSLVINIPLRSEILEFIEQNRQHINDDDIYLPSLWKANLANAIDNGNKDFVQNELRKYPRLSRMPLIGNHTALHLVCKSKSAGAIDILHLLIGTHGIERAKQIITKVDDEESPIYLAARYGDAVIIKKLIELLNLKAGDFKKMLYPNNGWESSELNQLFFETARTDNIELLVVLLNLGANISAHCNDHGNTALLESASWGKINTVKWLLENGSKINEVNKYGNTAFLSTAHTDHIAMLDWLLTNTSSNLKEVNNYHANPVICAAWMGQPRTIQWLVERGCDLEHAKDNGATAFIEAAYKGHQSSIEILLKLGANYKAKTKDGKTALDVANDEIKGFIVETIKNLKNHRRQDTSQFDRKLFESQQHIQQQQKEIEVLKNTIDALKAEIKIGHAGLGSSQHSIWKNKNEAKGYIKNDLAKQSLLSFAVCQNALELARTLLKEGANPNQNILTGDYANWSLLAFAVRKKHVQMARSLLEMGADHPNQIIQSGDWKGWSLLTFAVHQHEVEMSYYLLEKGADPNQLIQSGDWKGWTLLAYAVRKEQTEIVHCLLEKGVNPNQKFGDWQEGWTPLAFAVRNHKINIANHLIQRGAATNIKFPNGDYQGYSLERYINQNKLAINLAPISFRSTSDGKTANSKFGSLLAKANILLNQENNKDLVQIVFTDHQLLQQFSDELHKIGISNLGMKDEPRKPQVTIGKDGKEDEYVILLSADEYNAVMDEEDAYAKLVTGSSSQPSFRHK
jgi:ankyrin repeat protein